MRKRITLLKTTFPRMRVTRIRVTKATLPSIGLHVYVERNVNLLLTKKNFANKLTVTSNGLMIPRVWLQMRENWLRGYFQS